MHSETSGTTVSQPWAVGTPLTRWNLSSVEVTYYPGTAQPLEDRVTYAFVNGWVATGDLPCRQALRREIATRRLTFPKGLTFDRVYLGSETGDVDLSGFSHRPTWQVCHARAVLEVPHDQTITLRLTTCGSVTLWLDGRECGRFEPFERNRKNATEITLDLEAGTHALVVRFEDMHERDTIYGFRLDLVAGQGLRAGIQADADPARLTEAAEVLEGLRTVAVFNRSQKVALTSDVLPTETLSLTCAELPGQGGAIGSEHPHITFEMPLGCRVLQFATQVGDVTLHRNLGTTVMTRAQPLTGQNVAARKQALLDCAACPLDVAERLAALARGEALAADALDRPLRFMEERWDCADFGLMGLLWIWARYRDGLPAPLQARLRDALLGFRYWMDEPGNDVMWFWSENHVLCFQVGQYLAGQFFPDEVFPNSGQDGRTRQAQARARLNKWFAAVERHGLVEWNSAAYYPINHRGLLTLFALTDDAEMRDAARRALDRISTMVALHQIGGVPAGSQGRAYEKELLAGPMTELGAVAAILFGGLHVPGWDGAAVLLALSDYLPPDGLDRFAAPQPGQPVSAQYTQGVDGAARLHLWKTAHVQMSSVAHHRPHTLGNQQHVIDIQFAADPLARVWINHPATRRCGVRRARPSGPAAGGCRMWCRPTTRR